MRPVHLWQHTMDGSYHALLAATWMASRQSPTSILHEVADVQSPAIGTTELLRQEHYLDGRLRYAPIGLAHRPFSSHPQMQNYFIPTLFHDK